MDNDGFSYTQLTLVRLIIPGNLATNFDRKCRSSSGHFIRTRTHAETKYREVDVPLYIKNTLKMYLHCIKV